MFSGGVCRTGLIDGPTSWVHLDSNSARLVAFAPGSGFADAAIVAAADYPCRLPFLTEHGRLGPPTPPPGTLCSPGLVPFDCLLEHSLSLLSLSCVLRAGTVPPVGVAVREKAWRRAQRPITRDERGRTWGSRGSSISLFLDYSWFRYRRSCFQFPCGSVGSFPVSIVTMPKKIAVAALTSSLAGVVNVRISLSG